MLGGINLLNPLDINRRNNFLYHDFIKAIVPEIVFKTYRVIFMTLLMASLTLGYIYTLYSYIVEDKHDMYFVIATTCLYLFFLILTYVTYKGFIRDQTKTSSNTEPT